MRGQKMCSSVALRPKPMTAPPYCWASAPSGLKRWPTSLTQTILVTSTMPGFRIHLDLYEVRLPGHDVILRIRLPIDSQSRHGAGDRMKDRRINAPENIRHFPHCLPFAGFAFSKTMLSLISRSSGFLSGKKCRAFALTK